MRYFFIFFCGATISFIGVDNACSQVTARIEHTENSSSAASSVAKINRNNMTEAELKKIPVASIEKLFPVNTKTSQMMLNADQSNTTGKTIPSSHLEVKSASVEINPEVNLKPKSNSEKK